MALLSVFIPTPLLIIISKVALSFILTVLLLRFAKLESSMDRPHHCVLKTITALQVNVSNHISHHHISMSPSHGPKNI